MRCGVSLLLLLQQSVPAVANLDELAYRLVNTYTANLEIDPQQHNYELHHPEPEAQANWNRMTRQASCAQREMKGERWRDDDATQRGYLILFYY